MNYATSTHLFNVNNGSIKTLCETSYPYFPVESYLYFAVYGQNHIRIFPHMDRIISLFSRIGTESDRYFPIFGQDRIFCSNTGKYVYDSVYVRESTDQRKPVFCQVSHSETCSGDSMNRNRTILHSLLPL